MKTFVQNPQFSSLSEGEPYSSRRSEYIGEFAVIRESRMKRDDIYFSRHLTFLVKVDDPCVSDEQINNALYDSCRSSCHCSHDCCGHVFSSLGKTKKVKQIDPFTQIWIARESGGKNY